MRALPLILTLGLTACAELPPLKGSLAPQAAIAPAPVILPLETILAQATLPSQAQAAQGALITRSARLRGVRLPGPVTGDLAARAARLRARAEALRNATL